MISALNYTTQRAGIARTLAADKNVTQLNAWHLKTITGTGMPPVATTGAASFGLAGRSYNGVSVDARAIDCELYADGYSATALQNMLDAAPALVTPDDALGVLTLTNSSGKAYRIKAKCTAFEVAKYYSRAALCSLAFDCPVPWFEDDALQSAPFFAVEGGKEYVAGEGLARPYTFGNVQPDDTLDKTIVATNGGDIAAPCVVRLYGSGIEAVTLANETTGATITIAGTNAAGVEISTDPDNLYARLADGSDASAYVSLACNLADFQLRPGANVVRVQIEATAVEPAGAVLEWRGRFSQCL